MAKITYQQLQDLNACSKQLQLFKELFGDSVELTESVVLEHGHKFDIEWFAFKILLLAEYNKQVAPLWAEYNKQVAPLWAEYDKQKALLFVRLYNSLYNM